MPLQHLQLLAVFQTDQIVGLHRCTDGNLGLKLDLGLGRLTAQTRKGAVNVLDQLRQVVDRHAVVADVGGHNIGSEGDQRFSILVIIVHREQS